MFRVLKNSFRSLFPNSPKKARPAHPSTKTKWRSQLCVEALETRYLSAVNLTASLSGGILSIEGPERADTIRVRQNAGKISVDGLQITMGNTRVSNVSASQVKSISIKALGGND